MHQRCRAQAQNLLNFRCTELSCRTSAVLATACDDHAGVTASREQAAGLGRASTWCWTVCHLSRRPHSFCTTQAVRRVWGRQWTEWRRYKVLNASPLPCAGGQAPSVLRSDQGRAQSAQSAHWLMQLTDRTCNMCPDEPEAGGMPSQQQGSSRHSSKTARCLGQPGQGLESSGTRGREHGLTCQRGGACHPEACLGQTSGPASQPGCHLACGLAKPSPSEGKSSGCAGVGRVPC